ncbi:hypothetical protein BDV19DRAFT_312467 [Aspergillus venezuelensis]
MNPAANPPSGQRPPSLDSFAQLKDDVKAVISKVLSQCVDSKSGNEIVSNKEITPGILNFDTVDADMRYGNDCFIPPSRQSRSLEDIEPTLVILTGTNEQLPELQASAKRWFAVTRGDVRMVLIHTINARNHTMLIEQWQLRRPYMARARLMNPPMCPRDRQPAHLQLPFCAQRRTLTPTGLIGGPLLLHFEALMDRDPVGLDCDLVIGWGDLRDISRTLLSL